MPGVSQGATVHCTGDRPGTLTVLNGLEAGADDYLTKAFSIAELRARIQSRLRRTAPTR